MALPTPGPQHAQLARLAGDWAGDESIHPSAAYAERERTRGRFRIRMVCNGFVLSSDYEEHLDGDLVYAGHGVYGWQPDLERYTMYWWDSSGTPGYVRPVLGTFEDDRLCFEQETDSGLSRYVYEIVSDDEFTFRLESSPEGTIWHTRMDGRYSRR